MHILSHHLAQQLFEDTSLGPLYDAATTKEMGGITVELAPGAERYLGGENAHEAAYDAYMTGAVFARFVAGSLVSLSITHLTHTPFFFDIFLPSCQ